MKDLEEGSYQDSESTLREMAACQLLWPTVAGRDQVRREPRE